MADIKDTTVKTAETGEKTGPSMAEQLQSAYQQRQDTSAQKIGGLYDTALESQKLALRNAYEQNLSDQEAARAKIGGQYQQSANDLAIQYERNRRNLNQQAAARGLNTGAASQQQLALNQGYLTNYGKLRGQEAGAMAEAERQITNLKNTYQNNIASAIADNDYKKAAALLDDYNNQQNWMDQQAQLMATFGQFGGYENLYGKDMADAMAKVWASQNPEVAWSLGLIDAATYKKVTGKRAPGSGGGGGGYWGGWGGGGSGGGGDNGMSPDGGSGGGGGTWGVRLRDPGGSGGGGGGGKPVIGGGGTTINWDGGSGWQGRI